MAKAKRVRRESEEHRRGLIRLGLAGLFLMGIWLYASATGQDIPNAPILIFAAVIGGYMALNIGANDVANNIGPAVGSGAITMTVAIVMAALFEAAGAIIAGGEVVDTIKGGIIDPNAVADTQTFIWLMTAALLAGALWLNLATWMGAPVSTTHSIVGGVLGAGIAAGGLGIADWGVMAGIAASWVVSPVMGGGIAAIMLYFITHTVLHKSDRGAAATRIVPWILGLMAWAFSTYIIVKGLKQLWQSSFFEAAGIGLVIAVVVGVVSRRYLKRFENKVRNDRGGVNTLFTWPLIFGAALLSFAHGANDVANAVGPLAAINEAVQGGGISAEAGIPFWIMLIGALGLSLGLALYGPKLIKTVGSEITELDQTRAFCIALSAAITVIIASQLGLPVSSTHTALGAVFGVGFLREYMKVSYASRLHSIISQHEGPERERLQVFLDDFRQASLEEMDEMIKSTKRKRNPEIVLKKKERKRLKSIYKEELVKRNQLYRIVAAWIITVPASGIIAAILFFTLRGMLGFS